MKNIFDHIEQVKGKPHHVRKRIAFGAAALGSAFIALVWFTGSVMTGSFALHESNFAMSTGQENPIVKVSDTGSQNLAGVAAAAALQSPNAPAHIEIVDTAASTAPSKPSEQTTIPF